MKQIFYFFIASDKITFERGYVVRERVTNCNVVIIKIFFLPKRADVGKVETELETGGCVMMIGRAEGKFRP